MKIVDIKLRTNISKNKAWVKVHRLIIRIEFYHFNFFAISNYGTETNLNKRSKYLLFFQAKEIILRHVVPTKILFNEVTSGQYKTNGGEMINLVKFRNGAVQIMGPTSTVEVVRADILATNGVIHVINDVVL